MSIQITDISELGEAFIMRGIETSVTLLKRRVRKSLCHLGRSNRKREVGIPVEDA